MHPDTLSDISNYRPWFPQNQQKQSQCIGAITDSHWFNLLDVLFWYCCLQRKNLGEAPDEIDLVDASPILSGMLDAHPSVRDCLDHIISAMDFLFPDAELRKLLFVEALKDLGGLLGDRANCRKALDDIHCRSFGASPNQAHCHRLAKLQCWFEAVSSDQCTKMLASLSSSLLAHQPR